MTNTPQPNDLSHLSDEEFHALCPIGEHAPGPEPLSPAAQAVLEASHEAWVTKDDPISIAAAVLRAAADQVVPDNEITPWGSTVALSKPAASIRASLLAIAAELEGASAE